MREHVDNLVRKSIDCGNIENGFAQYVCEDCGDITKVPFTCKSKFCNKCGRLYTLKWNQHVHALVTEGAINKNINWWKSVDYIPYPFLKKSWQRVLLNIIKKHFNSYETRQLISKMYKKYPNGFYVNAERKLNDTRQAVKYIGRYLARAAIAEYRIEEYDGQQVTFWYKDHDNGQQVSVTMNVMEFIGKITQHIVPKGFKTARRYGLYSRRRNKISKQIVHLYNYIKQGTIRELLNEKKSNDIKKSWKERIIETFEINPLKCKKCGTEKILWKVWHKDYGVIYDMKETSDREEISYESISKTYIHRKNIQISLLEM